MKNSTNKVGKVYKILYFLSYASVFINNTNFSCKIISDYERPTYEKIKKLVESLNPLDKKLLDRIYIFDGCEQPEKEIEEILLNGANVNIRHFIPITEDIDDYLNTRSSLFAFTGAQTPLISAIRAQMRRSDETVRLKIVQLLLKKGADPHLTDIYGATPLQAALFTLDANIEIIKILLDYGADLDKSMIKKLKVRLEEDKLSSRWDKAELENLENIISLLEDVYEKRKAARRTAILFATPLPVDLVNVVMDYDLE